MMDKAILVKQLSLGESSFVEEQNLFNSDKICQSICSFLNSQGGFILCGMEDYNSSEEVENRKIEIEGRVAAEFSPRATVFVNKKDIENKTILVIEVPEGKDKPYAFINHVYIRDSKNSSPIEADIETIKDLIFTSQTTPLRWERRFSDEIEPEMFSHDEIKALYSIPLLQHKDTLMEKLEELSLMRQGRLTNAADILLTENPAMRHPQIRVRAACFLKKTDTSYRDYKVFEGPALQILNEVLHFIQRNTFSQADFSDNQPQRTMHTQYPIKAVREGLVNAFAHRDYESYSGGIRIEIEQDKLSIWNAGKLPKGITVETLQSGHVSVLRNPDIANYFYLREYMEMLGRGSLLIQEECQKNGNPKPQWKNDSTGVTLILFALRPEIGPKNGPENEPEKGPELNASEKEVIRLLDISNYSKAELVKQMGLKSVSGGLKRAIKHLWELGLIQWTIPGTPRSRYQKYALTDNGKQYAKGLKQ